MAISLRKHKRRAAAGMVRRRIRSIFALQAAESFFHESRMPIRWDASMTWEWMTFIPAPWEPEGKRGRMLFCIDQAA